MTRAASGARAVLIAMGMGKGGLRPGPDAWRGERSDEGEKRRRSPAQVMVNDLVGCAGERPRSADESVADSRAVKEAANQPYPTGRRREEAVGRDNAPTTA
ncbi:MAG: hypothetical protein OXI91_14930 [Chloroflexota bacterium]|nr:hypothetical protein [Chloroflexota bacterium]